uniref:Rho GDP-dissociation inhibitor 3 n=1 Tax=Glossina brevipalpis TaxID=37001 RepID=A0A1A9WMA8_9MUSC
MNDIELYETEKDLQGFKYQPPSEKTIEEIITADKEDESLQLYKQALLGATGATQGDNIVVNANNLGKVLIKKIALIVEGRKDIELDLTENISQFKKQIFVVKEGIEYKVRIDFFVQREIVLGLKFVQKSYRSCSPVAQTTWMVGSYPPKKEMYCYISPSEEAPSGLMARGIYSMSSFFIDDDKYLYLKWDWTLKVQEDWE